MHPDSEQAFEGHTNACDTSRLLGCAFPQALAQQWDVGIWASIIIIISDILAKLLKNTIYRSLGVLG